jgi:hypothetical protein
MRATEKTPCLILLLSIDVLKNVNSRASYHPFIMPKFHILLTPLGIAGAWIDLISTSFCHSIIYLLVHRRTFELAVNDSWKEYVRRNFVTGPFYYSILDFAQQFEHFCQQLLPVCY